MISVSQLPSNDLLINCHFSYKDRIRKVLGAKFDRNNKQWTLPLYSLGALEAQFDDEIFYKTPRWVILNEKAPDISDMYKIDDPSITCPDMKMKLYDYQKYGVRFMIDKLKKHGFVINGDDVGTGKTVQTIGTILWHIQNKGMKKFLIICKKSAKKQWSDEFDKFTNMKDDGFEIIWTESTAAKRKKAYEKFKKSDKGVLITNYHSFLNDSGMIAALNPEMVIIDEAHVVKARTGKMNNNIMSVCKGLPTIFLTGTPVMSKPMDIYGIIQIANPKYFGTWKEFSNRFLVWEKTNFGIECVGAKNLSILRKMVQDVLIQRTEYEISIELPKTVMIKHTCDMDSTQEKLLVAIHEKQMEIISEIERIDSVNKDGSNMALRKKKDMLDAQSKALIAARQAASTDPRMFLMSSSKTMREHYGSMIPKTYKMSPKMEQVIDDVESIVGNNDKVIIFTKYRTSAVMLKNDIKKMLKQDVLMYTGAENEFERISAITMFTTTNNYNILIGTDALAESVNLQVAKYVIMLDQPDTYAIKRQRIGRARRAGSLHDRVIVYDEITGSTGKAKSKDEERLENITNTKGVTEALIELDESQRKALMEEMKKEG